MRYNQLTITRVDVPTSSFGYRYLVQNYGTSHTAFRTLKAVKRWLKDHNLRTKLIWKEGHGKYTRAIYNVIGAIDEQISLWSHDEFNAINATVERKDLCNGSYTLYKIIHSDNGGCMTWCMNPNVKDRPLYDYKECEAAKNRGE